MIESAKNRDFGYYVTIMRSLSGKHVAISNCHPQMMHDDETISNQKKNNKRGDRLFVYLIYIYILMLFWGKLLGGQNEDSESATNFVCLYG